MAIEIANRTKGAPMLNIVTVDRRLFLTAGKDRLVDPDSPDAAFLWAGPGDEVAAAEAERLGYVAGHTVAEPEGDSVEALPDVDADEAADGEKQADTEGDKAVAEPEGDKAKAPGRRKADA